MELTQERLREVLDYNPSTGIFTWKVATSNRVRAGSRAGYTRRTRTGDYLGVSVDGIQYFAHRLAWFYTYGRWPTDQIDHINRDTLDNRISNLREATSAQNNANSRHKKGASGLRGAYREVGGAFYRARIHHNGKAVYLGSYSTAEEAHARWCQEAKKLRGEFTRTD